MTRITRLSGPFLLYEHKPRPYTLASSLFYLSPQRPSPSEATRARTPAPRGATAALPASPRPLLSAPHPQTHQVAQLGRLLLVIVQPSQGARPVFVHPEAHSSSSSRDPTLESPARARGGYPDAKTKLPASSKYRDVTTGHDVNILRRRGLREPSADRISRRVGVT